MKQLNENDKEVQTIALNTDDLNKYFLMKIKGEIKVAKLYEINIEKNEFAFIASDGVLYFTDEKGISYNMIDVFVIGKLEYFPFIDLTVNTKYGDVFITKNGHKLKYIYKLSSLNNQEFIYVFTDDNKVYYYNRYGEYNAYSRCNGNNLYVKYEEKIEENNTNNVLNNNKMTDFTKFDRCFAIAREILGKNANEQELNDFAYKLWCVDNQIIKELRLIDLIKEDIKRIEEENNTKQVIQPLDNKQNVDSTLNKNYNQTQYMDDYKMNKLFYQLAKEFLGESATQQQLDKLAEEIKNKFKEFKQEFKPYKEEAKKILSENNIETTDDELETFAAMFCEKNAKELPMNLTKIQQKKDHINELIDKLDNEYKGDIRDKVIIKNESTDIIDFISDFPLKINSFYINKEDLSIIYVKNIFPSKMRKEIEILTDKYMFNSNEEYMLYKNEYYTYDFSMLNKNYSIEKLKLYKEISQEDVNNVVNNIKITQDNINEIKKQFKNLLKNLIS